MTTGNNIDVKQAFSNALILRNICFFLVVVVVFLAWFDGLSVQIGKRSTTPSALFGLGLICFWVISKFAEAGIRGRLFVGYAPGPYRWFIGLFVVFILLAGFLSIPAIHDEFRFAVHFTSLGGMLLLFLIITDSVRTFRQARILLWTIVLGGATAAVVLLGMAMTGEIERATGIVGGNPNYAANRLLPVAVIVFFITFLRNMPAAIRFLSLSGMVIVSLALFATLSVSAILSFAVALVMGFFLLRRQTGFRRDWIAVVTVLVITGAMVYPGVASRLAGGIAQWRHGLAPKGHVASIVDRIELDRASLQIIGEFPLTGVGLGQHLPYMAAQGYGPSHNSHLLVFLELGAFAFIVYLMLLFLALTVYRMNPYISVVKIGIIAMLLHMFALGELLPKVLIVLLSLKFAFIKVLPKEPEKIPMKRSNTIFRFKRRLGFFFNRIG